MKNISKISKELDENGEIQKNIFGINYVFHK